ncbi:MAG: rcc01693 family protein [Pelagimonas sp.]|uniref:rcc01693 family protein n=1 Tax=Pelagimonas sp. TaxID=2073170 RepID=UPI003D6C1D5A
MKGFDWPELMRAGIRGLGLRPQEFWDLTPAELRLMLGEGDGSKPMGRSRLDELMGAFPDNTQPENKELVRNERE